MVAFRTLAVSSLLLVPAVFAEPISSPSGLYARQISGFDPSTIPTACIQQQCQAFINAASSGCATLDCLCTNTLVTNFKNCVQCAANANIPGYNQTVADNAVSGLVQACSTSGHPVTVSTSGGSSSSGTGGSSSGSSSAAGASTTGAPTTGSSTTGTTTKSGAIVGMGVSIVGSILALAVGGINFV